MVPVQDKECRAKLHHILDSCLSDNVKGAILQSDGSYRRVPSEPRRKRVRSQDLLCAEARARAAEQRQLKQNVFEPHRPE